MMDIETIIHLNKQAGKQAKKDEIKPKVLDYDDLHNLKQGDISSIRNIPNLGDHIPSGWSKFDVNKLKDKLSVPEWWYGCKILKGGELWCDSSGFGAPDEPSLTTPEFIDVVQKLYESYPEIGLGLCCTGQFQVGVRCYIEGLQ